jgi:hypothetical protein
MLSPTPTEEALSLRPEVVATVLEEGAVLLDLESKFFFSVNSSGWSIIQLFERGTSPAEVQAICRAWGASIEDRDAIERFVDTLVSERLVVPGPGEAAPAEGTTAPGEWVTPRLEKHKEPLQRVMVSAFDPSIPLAE